MTNENDARSAAFKDAEKAVRDLHKRLVAPGGDPDGGFNISSVINAIQAAALRPHVSPVADAAPTDQQTREALDSWADARAEISREEWHAEERERSRSAADDPSP